MEALKEKPFLTYDNFAVLKLQQLKNQMPALN